MPNQGKTVVFTKQESTFYTEELQNTDSILKQWLKEVKRWLRLKWLMVKRKVKRTQLIESKRRNFSVIQEKMY